MDMGSRLGHGVEHVPASDLGLENKNIRGFQDLDIFWIFEKRSRRLGNVYFDTDSNLTVEIVEILEFSIRVWSFLWKHFFLNFPKSSKFIKNDVFECPEAEFAIETVELLGCRMNFQSHILGWGGYGWWLMRISGRIKSQAPISTFLVTIS